MICPAYQSAFIHDQATLDRHFSYFGEDSMPKVLEASKDKHLLIDRVTYRKKMRSLQTVAMMDIYPQKPDSLSFDDDLLLAERDATSGDLYDSADLVKDHSIETEAANYGADSIYVISLKKEKFNIDQELYLWYMRKFLVYPDVKLQQEENAEAKGASAPKKKKEGFFKRLFGGKKNKSDSTSFDQETSATELDGEAPEEKKGFFSFLKKGDKPPKEKRQKTKKEKKSKDEPKEEEDPAPVEEEDDGEEDF